MTIYNDNIARSYVYKLVHKITGQFYFGYRCGNIRKNRIAIHDIGRYYKTSSKVIKELGFENFDYFILSEYNDRYSAYDNE